MYMQEGRKQFLKEVELLREETGEIKLSRAIASIMKGYDPAGSLIQEVFKFKSGK